jgi:hypothetical protein
LGNSLKKISSTELNLAILELATFIEKKFQINVNKSNILKSICDLPKELKTSSYFDFKQGLQSEIAIELEFVVTYLTDCDFKCSVLNKWKKVS